MSFKDIKGHDIQISLLQKEIERGSVAHAYLFVGIDGIGKGLVASTFAKTLNCESRQKDPCDICASCRKIDNKNHPDVFRIIPDEGGKTIKIDTIRALEERISFKPYEANWKVVIIEDAHLMTAEAANSILKTLEEPSPQSVIILTTSNISGIFQTVISRCQIVKFAPLSFDIVENILIKKFGLEKDNARFISRLSNGAVDKKLISEGESIIAWKNGIINEFMDGSFFREDSLMFSSKKADMQEAILVLINWYRDILIHKNGISEDSIINFDRIDDVNRFSMQLSCQDIDERLNNLIDAYLAVGQNVSPKLTIGTLI
ncbi:MAG: DNA polymerase III subunit delta' [Candidatus Omnitrophica bacterium CG07_land_8_20_14_0_80_42_15]|uniref:DNA polymerase III subunit delta n=1 Tax=Candidatus Aquitaenariimonas noxiae TaxID=1974741 RepID=A0A2J0L1Z6_9BACT|nr:MAG: DNA polymerase III subunit delta' [Candidatus Omnitrophica bacterium CG07_land_8_20_14_0_80_42_15]